MIKRWWERQGYRENRSKRALDVEERKKEGGSTQLEWPMDRGWSIQPTLACFVIFKSSAQGTALSGHGSTRTFHSLLDV